MSPELKAGVRLQSTVCDTQVAVVRADVTHIDLRCGGQPMVALGEHRGDGSPTPGFDEGTQIGKRYVDAGESIEILCTKPGDGSLSVGDEPLVVKGAKPLPSSD